MLPTWKNYGGLGNYESMNNVAVNSITADYLTLKNAYVGYFTICGEFFVTDQAFFYANVAVAGAQTVSGDVLVGGDLETRGNVLVDAGLTVSGDATVVGNLYLDHDFDLSGDLAVGGSLIQLGRVADGSYGILLGASGNLLGINTLTPEATLDVWSNQEMSFRVVSTQDQIQSIVAENGGGCGVEVYVDNSTCVLGFFQEDAVVGGAGGAGVGDGSLSYTRGGVMTLAAPSNTWIASPLVVGLWTGGQHMGMGETLAVGSGSGSVGAFLPEMYEISDASYVTGSAASFSTSTGDGLVGGSGSNASLTFLGNGAGAGPGAVMVGGQWILDSKRSYGSWGLLDPCGGSYLPTISQVTGTSGVTKRASVGINTFVPEMDDYVLSVNGPMHLQYGDIFVVEDVPYEISKMVVLKGSPQTAVAFGGPFSGSGGVYGRQILSTIDGGATWSTSVSVSAADFDYTTEKLLTGWLWDENVGIGAGEGGILIYSVDGFQTWNPIDGTSITSNIGAVGMFQQSDNSILVVLFYAPQQLGWFVLASINSLSNNLGGPFTVPSTSNEDCTGFRTLSLSGTAVDTVYGLDGLEASICYLVGLGGITALALSDTSTFASLSSPTASAPFVETAQSYASPGTTLRAVHLCPSQPQCVVAVGDGGAIYVTQDGGNTWVVGSVGVGGGLCDVAIYDVSSAVAVGEAGGIYASWDGLVTWVNLATAGTLLNTSGMQAILTNPVHTLSSVYLADPNTVVVSSIYTPLTLAVDGSGNPVVGTFGQSKLFSCVLPALFNRATHFVLDVCGNMRLSGDLYAYDDVYVTGGLEVSGNVVVGGTLVGQTVEATNFTDGGNGVVSVGVGDGHKTIVIGGGTNATPSNTILIGGPNDVVEITGANVSYRGAIQAGRTIVVNSGSVGNDTSVGAGLLFQDFDNASAGYVIVNPTLDGFLVKVPSLGNTNVVNLALNEWTGLTSYTDLGSGGAMQHGLLMVQPSTVGGVADVTVVTTPFDASSVFLKNTALSLETYVVGGNVANVQMVGTDVGVTGNLWVLNGMDVAPATRGGMGGGALHVVGGGSLTQSLYVGGNVYVAQQLDVSSASVFSGPVLVAGSASRLTVEGNVAMAGNVSLGTGSTLMADGLVVLRAPLEATGVGTGALQTVGGASIGGNLVVGENVVVLQTLEAMAGASVGGDAVIDGNVVIASPQDVSGTGAGGIAALWVDGGVAIHKSLSVTGNVVCAAISDTNNGGSVGGLQVTGGAAVAKSAFVGGNLWVAGNSPALGLGTGALQLNGGGGMSVTGNTYFGNNVVVGWNNLTTVIPVPGESTFLSNTNPAGPITLTTTGGQSYTGSISGGYLNGGIFNDVSGGGSFVSNWISSYTYLPSGAFVGATSTPVMSGAGITGVSGEWLQVQLPYGLFLTQYVLTVASTVGQPVAWTVLGSNDGATFATVQAVGGDGGGGASWVANGSGGALTWSYVLDVTTLTHSYTYYRFVCMACQPAPVAQPYNNVALAQWKLVGIPLYQSYAALVSSGTSNFIGNVTSAGVLGVTNTRAATSTATGALVVAGGAGVSGNVYVGGAGVANTWTVLNTSTLNGNVYAMGNVGIGTMTPRCALDVAGGVNISGSFSVAALGLTSTVASTSVSTGSLVAAGGAGIAGDVFVGGNVNVLGTTDASGGVGALVVQGGMSVEKTAVMNGNVLIYGNLVVATPVTTHNLTVNTLQVQGPSTFNGNCAVVAGNALAIGGVSLVSGTVGGGFSNTLYVNGGNVVLSSPLDVSAGTAALVVNGGGVVQKTWLVEGNLVAASGATLNTVWVSGVGDGALQTVGGASVGGNLMVGQNLHVAGEIDLTNLVLSGVAEATSTSTGTIVCAGGAGVALDMHVGGNVVSGALVVEGRAGISGNVFLAANVDSTSVGTGTLIVEGGSSLSGNCNIGGNVIITGSFGGSGVGTITFPAVDNYPAFSTFVDVSGGGGGGGSGGSATSITLQVTGFAVIDGFRNGSYTLSSGTVFPGSSVIAAFDPSLNASWISDYPYSETTGYSVDSTPLETVYSGGTYTAVGEFLQIGLPFSQILDTYAFVFDASLNSPIEWTVVGSNDGVTWSWVHHAVLSNTPLVNTATFSTGSGSAYYYFRVVFTRIAYAGGSTIANFGVSAWHYTATPVVQISNTSSSSSMGGGSGGSGSGSGGSGSGSGGGSGSGSGGSGSSYNTMASFIGPSTFAGNSSLVAFGDSTVYGKFNVFNDLNVNGNVNTTAKDNSLKVNADVTNEGHFTVNGVLTVLGTTALDSASIAALTATGDASVTGNLAVSAQISAATLAISEGLTITANIAASAADAGTGSLVVTGGVAVGGNVVVGGLGGSPATSSSTGSLVVNGGAGLSGDVYVGGNVRALKYMALSDYRLKEQVMPLGGEKGSSSYTIDALNPVWYRWKDTQEPAIGLLAHEVQEHLPFLVSGTKDGEEAQSIDYLGLIGLLIAEIQALKRAAGMSPPTPPKP